MSKYIDDILLKYEHIPGKCSSPAKEDFLLVDPDSPLLSPSDAMEYHSLVAKLLYLVKRVRPDILFPVVILATRVRAPSSWDYVKLKRVVRYLRGTSSIGMVLSASKSPSLEVSIDASFGVHADAKSHTGVTVSYGLGPLYSSSKKQSIVTKSSTEAELVGVTDAAGVIEDVVGTLRDLGEDIPYAVIFQDNMSTIKLIENGRSNSPRTRHINVRYFFLKERIENGDVKVVYQPTGDMIADILTKPLQGEDFKRARDRLLNWY
jgi:histone deacetylase 1/2